MYIYWPDLLCSMHGGGQLQGQKVKCGNYIRNLGDKLCIFSFGLLQAGHSVFSIGLFFPFICSLKGLLTIMAMESTIIASLLFLRYLRSTQKSHSIFPFHTIFLVLPPCVRSSPLTYLLFYSVGIVFIMTWSSQVHKLIALLETPSQNKWKGGKYSCFGVNSHIKASLHTLQDFQR